jgi:hypothetical protein
MSKRRTRKEKLNPKRNITISWQPGVSEAKNPDSEANVKRQLKKEENASPPKIKKNKLAVNTDKSTSLASIKKDLVRSLIFATLLIASQVMIYLIWS